MILMLIAMKTINLKITVKWLLCPLDLQQCEFWLMSLCGEYYCCCLCTKLIALVLLATFKTCSGNRALWVLLAMVPTLIKFVLMRPTNHKFWSTMMRPNGLKQLLTSDLNIFIYACRYAGHIQLYACYKDAMGKSTRQP